MNDSKPNLDLLEKSQLYFKSIAKTFLTARFSLLIVAFLTMLMWGMDQFYDLIIALPEEYKGISFNLRIVWFIIDITSIGLLVWFCLRKIMDLQYVKLGSPTNLKGRNIINRESQIFAYRFVPRFLSIFIILQFACLIISISEGYYLSRTPFSNKILSLFIPFFGALIFYFIGYYFSKEYKNEDIYPDKLENERKSLIKTFSNLKKKTFVDLPNTWNQRPIKENKINQIRSNISFLFSKKRNPSNKEDDDLNNLEKRKKLDFKKIPLFSLVTCTIVGIISLYIIIWILITIFFNLEDGVRWKLNSIAGILVVIAALFSLIDQLVVKTLLKIIKVDTNKWKESFKNTIANSSYYFSIGIFLIYSGIYIYSNICINKVDDSFFPLTTIVAGLSVWNITLSYLQKKGYDLSFPFITVAFIFVLFFVSLSNSYNNNLHEITTKNANTTGRTELSSFKNHFHKWKSDKSIEKDSSLITPIFVVTAQGGGSRAAAWTYRVLSALDRESQGKFSKNCYAISSVSGGSFGSSIFLSNLKNIQKTKKSVSPTDLSIINKVFARNYLASSISSITGKDFFNTFLHFFPSDDRDKILERKRASRLAQSFKDDNIEYKGTYNEDSLYLDYWYNKDTLKYFNMPLFFPNTTWVEKGARAVSSPIYFDALDFPNTLNITNEILQDSIRVCTKSTLGRKEIAFSTAAHLSSRFPIINSAGEIDGLGHFVDGGYYNNIGGQTTKAIIENLNNEIEKDTINKYKIILIRIYNGSKESAPTKQANINQLVAPIQGILNSPFTGHTEYSTKSLDTWKEYGRIDEIYDFQLDEKMKMKLNDENSIMEVKFPLARFLSKRAGKGIYFSIEDSENKDKFEVTKDYDPTSESTKNIIIDTKILRKNNANLKEIKSLLITN